MYSENVFLSLHIVFPWPCHGFMKVMRLSLKLKHYENYINLDIQLLYVKKLVGTRILYTIIQQSLSKS